MKFKFVLAALIIAPLALTACSKQDKAPASEQLSSSESVATEQQAAIDALDQPVLDEKNTDIPAEKANAPADAATPATDADASKAQ